MDRSRPASRSPASATASGRLEVLAGIDLDVAAGETVALVGPSGCGKSTLLELIAGLRPLQAGTIAIAGDRSPAGRTAALGLDAAERHAAAVEARRRQRRDRAAPGRRAIAPRAGERATRCSTTSGSAGSPSPARASSRAGCGSGSPSRGRCSPGTPVPAPRRAVRRARRDHPRRAPELARRGRSPAEGRTTLLVTHDVEEALYVADRVRPADAAARPRRGRRSSRPRCPSRGEPRRGDQPTPPSSPRAPRRSTALGGAA